MSGRPSFIYSIAPATASAVASDSFSGYAAANVLEASEDTGWRPADVTGDKTLTLDLQLALPVGAVAILGQYLNGITLEVRGSSDNFSTSDVQLSAPAAINSASYNSAYRQFTSAEYRYLRLVLSGFGASSEINYVAPCRTVSLPWLDDGHDLDCFQPTGSHLVGVAGTYLGATQQCAMRSFSLDFGQVTSAQYPAFQLWAEACIRTMRPFFFVPDSDQPECWFGWVEAKYKFSAPSKLGRHKIAPIPFLSRLP